MVVDPNMGSSGTNMGWRYAIIAALAIGITLLGLTNGSILGIRPQQTSIPIPVGSGSAPPNPTTTPAPTLFADSDLRPVILALYGQSHQASLDVEQFWSSNAHGTTDDTFARWAARQVRTQPTLIQRTADRAQVARIKRKGKRTRAAVWLSVNGCRNVWSTFVTRNIELQGDADQIPTQLELNTVLDLASRVAISAQRRFAGTQPVDDSPCTPRLRAVRSDCHCSFPSPTAAMSAAARTYLSAMAPMGRDEYIWMERQIDFANMYRGHELPSDLKSGAYLGYLVGQYFLASHGYEEPTASPEPTPTR